MWNATDKTAVLKPLPFDKPFILKGLRFHEPIQESFATLDDAVFTACLWSEPKGDLQAGFAAPLEIVDESGNVLMNQDQLSKAIDEKDLW